MKEKCLWVQKRVCHQTMNSHTLYPALHPTSYLHGDIHPGTTWTLMSLTAPSKTPQLTPASDSRGQLRTRHSKGYLSLHTSRQHSRINSACPWHNSSFPCMPRQCLPLDNKVLTNISLNDFTSLNLMWCLWCWSRDKLQLEPVSSSSLSWDATYLWSTEWHLWNKYRGSSEN